MFSIHFSSALSLLFLSSSLITCNALSVHNYETSTDALNNAITLDKRAVPAPWEYQGCWVDNAYGRILPVQKPDNSTLTVESCVAMCQASNYNVTGIEYGKQCFCGNALYNGAVKASADNQCNMPCAGDSTEKCGAGNRMSVYAIPIMQVLKRPTQQNDSLPGSWKLGGCLSVLMCGGQSREGQNNQRVFQYQLILANNNSATNCLSQCSAYGYNAGGMEYGRECFCGDYGNIAAVNATLRPDSECGTVCTGDPLYLCGGGSRLTYYTWTGPDLYTWNYASGNNAGAYQFLVGGVVVPLITTQGINGKVTFVEKHGTGAPNSTGAYELDVSLVNNATAAWRTMKGLKTDVFCSAGLVLPDKAGRQINIGGWSGNSRFGVRLYWPDGSPGVASANDWQENQNEVALQVARWYPSAMIMANGSILVVGGEIGSNDKAQPSVEILPRPAGGLLVYEDFLQRTDPNNLYPFLAVLPSGGVFIAYWNEARILDESTLLTTKTLPNMPGAVNNFQGGRTYPLEGTMVLLPQYAPYTDPLTVLVCGGSTVGAAVAIDNCVSTQPEVSNPVWTIERMPSQRVMTCMTALPDGTYLILNGAHHGAAGFGLGSDPNMNAILYDPTKPVNTRFTVMANTTVARLYHSEAILLQDGRVLVSGSDPQSKSYPEEYRVEVFVPPYLLSNLTRPTFSIQNKDWTYGQSISISVNASSSNIRVSLMGAESSTHGNTMGQRTFFPQVSCSGSDCTIIAPPNSHVCPPGWFQLFVLDGPTPSIATYVRIGGDPAALGNWPNFPDFKVPGI